MISDIKLIQGDCLEEMKSIQDKSIDMILCDLPYGTTYNKWDERINLNLLWEQYKRIIKDNGAICLFAQIPFSITVGSSNIKWLRYEWIYEKGIATGFFHAKKMPMKAHENILVFYKHLPTYNPQFTPGKPYTRKIGKHKSDNYPETKPYATIDTEGKRYPRDVLRINKKVSNHNLHPTAKPVELCEYLIKTYTNKGDLVLDNCMGSGTTGVACINTGRRFIGIEKEEKYYKIASERIEDMKGTKQ